MSSLLSSANASNPAVKRIMREYAEFQQSYPTTRQSVSADSAAVDVVAAPLDDNLFEWHFTLRGPPGSPYAGGLYHGRVLLPSNYPFRPPDIVLLTPSGRFETGKKICLSISSFHPNNWQPSWSIRTALTALSAFFTTPAAGAIGSLDYPDREKQQLAAKSREFVCPHCKLSNATIMHKHSSGQWRAAAGTSGAEATAGLATTDSGADKCDTHQPPASNVLSLSSNTPTIDANLTHVHHGVLASHPLQSTVVVQQFADSNSTDHMNRGLPLSASLAQAHDTATATAQPHSAAHDTASSHLSTLPLSSTTRAAHSARPQSTGNTDEPEPAASHSALLLSTPTPSARSTTAPSTASAAAADSSSPATVLPTATRVSASSHSRLTAVTVSLAVLVCALLFRKLVAHMLQSHPSHASIQLHSM